jgi:hypothetical protein
MEVLGPGISLLDPASPDQGRNMKKFGLKINVDPIRSKKKVFIAKYLDVPSLITGSVVDQINCPSAQSR